MYQYHRGIIYRRLYALILIFVMLVSLTPADAATDYDLTYGVYPTESTYETNTLGDVALMRLAAYGIVDEKFLNPDNEATKPVSRLNAVSLLYNAFGETANTQIRSPFTDVPNEYIQAVNWAYEQGVTRGVSDSLFGNGDISEQSFVTMILRYMKCDEDSCEDVLSYADTIGLSPVGLSDGFTLGDAALYLMDAAECIASQNGTSVKDAFGIDREIEQILFPYIIKVYPHSIEEAQLLLQEALNNCATIIIVSNKYLNQNDWLALYKNYTNIAYEIESDNCSETPWYINVLEPNTTLNPINLISYSNQANFPYWEKYKAFEKEITSQLTNEEIKWFDWSYQLKTAKAEYIGISSEIKFIPDYSIEWYTARDIDEVFTIFKDDSFSKAADAFYEKYIASFAYETDYDIIMASKKAIVECASYGSINDVEAHTFEGFFEDGRIVCDGYASIFKYLMIRSNIPCVTVLGSTISSKYAEDGNTDHAWNKVMIGETWYNIDICWADTGWPKTFDLKSDSHFEKYRHWITTYKGGTFVANSNYR